jgi:hypothetical protein
MTTSDLQNSGDHQRLLTLSVQHDSSAYAAQPLRRLNRTVQSKWEEPCRRAIDVPYADPSARRSQQAREDTHVAEASTL